MKLSNIMYFLEILSFCLKPLTEQYFSGVQRVHHRNPPSFLWKPEQRNLIIIIYD